MELTGSKYFNLNGKIFPSDRATIMLDNRALNYGDGVFETIRVKKGKALFVASHFERLEKGMNLLSLGPLDQFSATVLSADIEELIQANGIFEGGRIKLIVYRKSGGYYIPNTNQFDYIITAQPLDQNEYSLNKSGLALGNYRTVLKPNNALSNIKTLNSLVYVLGGIYARANGFDEALISNQHDQIIETTSCNLFVLKGKNLLTPPLSAGCLDGVMRKKIIQLTPKLGLTVQEIELDKAELILADEIWLSNVISGVKWVGAFEKKRFFNTQAKQLIQLLNKLK